MNSFQSVTVRLTGCVTVTEGGGAAGCACAVLSQPASASANSNPIGAAPHRARWQKELRSSRIAGIGYSNLSVAHTSVSSRVQNVKIKSERSTDGKLLP